VVQALRGVDLEIGPGEVLGLVGESGSGKSVLGLTLLGLHPAATTTISGSVELAGAEMAGASPEAWRLARKLQLGAIFQDPMTSLNPTMRIGRQVSEAAGSDEEALRLLKAVGVPDAEHRARSFPHQLSGGLRQRVMIAMAVAGPPKLVVADEPTTALDVTVQAQILSLLRRLRDELGMAMLFITHDLGVASQVADRIAVLYAGQLMEVGPSRAMLADPSHPYTRGLMRSRLTLRTERARRIAALPGEPPDPAAPPPGCPFVPRCALADPHCRAEPAPLRPIGPHPADQRPADQTWAACWHAAETPAGEAVVGEAWAAPAHTGGLAVLVNQATKSFVLRKGLRTRALHALRGIDLEIGEGEAVALVGESGSGKSTLLRAIAGLLALDGGSVELGMPGQPQMVFQDAGASLTPWLSVGSLVAERLVAAKVSPQERRARVTEALESVGLGAEVARAKPRQLSGGQRQRVALARAIAVPPPLLLCDEPTSALDVSLAATILNLIGELRRQLSMAVLFVTHDLAVARMIADRVAVMYLGRVVEIGPVQQVTMLPRHPYTAALLASVPEPGAELASPRGEPASLVDLPAGCTFAPRCPRAADDCRAEDPLLVNEQDGPRLGHAVACWHPLSEPGGGT
jgi:peptide/nickel transport system ATP-binding protein